MTRQDQITKAEKEAEAQLAILRALKRCSDPMAVLEAVRHILEADSFVPGILEKLAR
jgi:hypothetical protein